MKPPPAAPPVLASRLPRLVPRPPPLLLLLCCGVGSAPLIFYYMFQRRGFARPTSLVATSLENIVIFLLFLLLWLQVMAASTPLSSSTIVKTKSKKEQRRHIARVLLFLVLVFFYSFIIASQITAIALMSTRMNSSFIEGIVYAVRTGTWGETDAKFFFPSVVFGTMGIELFCLLVGYRALGAYEHSQAKRKTKSPMPSAAMAAVNTKKKLGFAVLTLGLMRLVFLSRAFSPVCNTMYSIAQYMDRYDRSFRYRVQGPNGFHKVETTSKEQPPLKQKQRQEQAPGQQQQQQQGYAYDFEALKSSLLPLDKKNRKNIVFILSDSLGNCLFKTAEGLEQSPFYTQVVKKHPDYYDFGNTRAVSGNTITAATAIMTGYYVSASSTNDEALSYFELPSLFNMAKVLGYRLALYTPYDTTDWWPFDEILIRNFDVVVSRTELKKEGMYICVCMYIYVCMYASMSRES